MAEPLRKISFEETALQDAADAWADAVERCDLEECLAWYAHDAAVLGTQAPVALGIDEIRRHWQRRMEATAYQLRMHPVRLELSEAEDMACQIGRYDLQLRRWEEGPEQFFHGYFILVWVRTTDGGWRIRWDLYNVSEPHPEHEAAA